MITRLREIIKNSNNIVFFGGAGVSTESNIPDFRSESGIYNIQSKYGYSPEIMLSHTYFTNNKKEFFDFYRDTMIYDDAKPNKAHLALAKLEEQDKVKAVITQNIDGLHQLAGSKEVLELHGSTLRNYCMDCGQSYDFNFIKQSKDIPLCKKCSGPVRPDVVLYEEGLDMNILNRAVDYISKADTLIVGGTSLAVYPAAGLIDYFKGDNLVLINKSSTPYDHMANLVINDSIGKVLSQVIQNNLDR